MTPKLSFSLVISTHQGLEPPFSPLWAAASPAGLTAFEFGISEAAFAAGLRKRYPHAALLNAAEPHPAITQVIEYLSRQRREFSLPIDLQAFTPFQQQVYRAVQQIPYGQTATYGQIADLLGRVHGARAVGAANGANPISIIIPCHRLVGADGSLRGYGGAGGTATKAWLLGYEKRTAGQVTA